MMIKLERSILAGLGHEHPTPAVVRAALQRAIELEHSTIPLYLYALYSLVPGQNDEIAQVLESVVVEEMLHMVLAANMLNALGGEPEIASPRFIPRYPGKLPGGIEQHLTVHLRPFSLEQLEAFIEIEEPRDPFDHQTLLSAEVDEPCTIGEFYTLIQIALTKIEPAAFVSVPRHQVGPEFMYGAVVVSDSRSAANAIEVIVEQGEGTATSPEEVAGFGGVNDFAHFYRFLEIQRGRRLVKVGEAIDVGYDYSGEPISFSPEGVYPLPHDPTRECYPPGSPERYLIEMFNFTYTTLLQTLERLVNGHNDATTFSRALELMRSLRHQALVMASGEAQAGVHLGPTFEYQPVSPEALASEWAAS